MNRNIARTLLSGALLGLFLVPLQAGGQRAAAAPAWRTSWTAFVEAVNSFKKEGKEFPEATFQMLLKGQRVPETFLVMRQFNGRVTFEGTFKGVTTEDLMDGMTSSISAWKATPPGASVRFSAVITGVAGVEPLPGRFGPVMLLENAEPTK